MKKPIFPKVWACLLWDKVRAYQIDDPDSPLKFSDRLAKENLWDKEFTLRAIEEYKRFMFLAAVGREPVTPSLEIDEVWHLHMLYTREYHKFCGVLGKFVHHGPTRGIKEEDEGFVDWYGNTKIEYMNWFAEDPPSDLWPPSKVRFRPVHFARVDLVKNWVIPIGDWRTLLRCFWRFIKWRTKNLI